MTPTKQISDLPVISTVFLAGSGLEKTGGSGTPLQSYYGHLEDRPGEPGPACLHLRLDRSYDDETVFLVCQACGTHASEPRCAGTVEKTGKRCRNIPWDDGQPCCLKHREPMAPEMLKARKADRDRAVKVRRQAVSRRAWRMLRTKGEYA